MLAVASMLRDVSSIDRLRKSISLKLQAEGRRDKNCESNEETAKD